MILYGGSANGTGQAVQEAAKRSYDARMRQQRYDKRNSAGTAQRDNAAMEQERKRPGPIRNDLATVRQDSLANR
jgi:hypothetical protein